MTLELLDQVHLQVGAAGYLEYFEHRQQHDMVLAPPRLLDEMGSLLEQILQAQQGPDALVERIFVGNHIAAG